MTCLNLEFLLSFQVFYFFLHICPELKNNLLPLLGTETNHENDYAYLGTSPNLVCQDIDYWSSGAKVDTAYVDYECSNDKIKGLIQTYGSALIAIYASDDDFNNYASGVFDTCS